MKSYLRNSDERKAEIVNKFLEKHFYSKYTTDYRYYTDKETQIKGIDTTFVYNGKKYVCDEKAAVHYCNVDLNTYAFEVCSLNRADNIQMGWLLDESKQNDSFMLVWMKRTDSDELKDISEIREIDMMLVQRSRLREYLDSIGWDREHLIGQAMKMWNDCNVTKYFCPDTKSEMRMTVKLPEKPVNIRILKDEISKFADCYFRIQA